MRADHSPFNFDVLPFLFTHQLFILLFMSQNFILFYLKKSIITNKVQEDAPRDQLKKYPFSR
jgi:hypothetical protein